MQFYVFTADLYFSVNDVFTENHSCHGVLMYPRVHGCTLASKAPLSQGGDTPIDAVVRAATGVKKS